MEAARQNQLLIGKGGTSKRDSRHAAAQHFEVDVDDFTLRLKPASSK